MVISGSTFKRKAEFEKLKATEIKSENNELLDPELLMEFDDDDDDKGKNTKKNSSIIEKLNR